MGRLVLAGTLVVTVVGIAHAAPKRKVHVETEPGGATVYLDDIESGPVCDATPCTITAPIGESTIIIRLDRYEAVIEPLEVPRGRRALQRTYKLQSALGTIVVDTPRGALVRVDEQEKGTAPVRVEVPSADAHHVAVVLDGKSVYDDIIEVATGDEFVVKPKLAALDDTTTITDDDDGGDTDGSGAGSGSETGITAGTDAGPRPTYVTAAAAFDVGFRKFTYDNVDTKNTLRDETEGGQVMGGAAVELWPGRMLGVHFLRGLSLFGRAQFPVAGQTVQGTLMGTVKTKWSSFEASLRQRWVFGPIGFEASGGFVQDNFAFDATDSRDLALVPDASYQSLRLGGTLVFVAGAAEPYISGENRIVLQGGPVGTRFDRAEVSGLRGSVGLLLNLGAICARVEGTLMNYSWQFAYDPSDPARATGATDSIKLISGLLGYSY
jgi:hypothetical protein